jgi:hypothetical protein
MRDFGGKFQMAKVSGSWFNWMQISTILLSTSDDLMEI